MRKAETIVTPIATAAYAWLNQPDTAFKQNKYKVTLLLDKKDKKNTSFIKKINDAHKKAANGGDTPSPVKDGDKTDKEGQEGHWVFTAKTNFKPKLVDTQRKQLSEDSAPMSGDLVRAAISLHSYDTGSAAGVSVLLMAVQLVEKRNQGSHSTSAFDDIDGFVEDDVDESDEEDDEEDF